MAGRWVGKWDDHGGDWDETGLYVEHWAAVDRSGTGWDKDVVWLCRKHEEEDGKLGRKLVGDSRDLEGIDELGGDWDRTDR